MVEQEYHEMVLESVHPSGAEEWYCPTCGRRFLMQWPPAYSKVILESGDEDAIHSGGKTGLKPAGSGLIPAQQTDEDVILSNDEQERLGPWMDWLEKVDFESLWEKDTKS
jgi:hypothetical protein